MGSLISSLQCILIHCVHCWLLFPFYFHPLPFSHVPAFIKYSHRFINLDSFSYSLWLQVPAPAIHSIVFFLLLIFQTLCWDFSQINPIVFPMHLIFMVARTFHGELNAHSIGNGNFITVLI